MADTRASHSSTIVIAVVLVGLGFLVLALTLAGSNAAWIYVPAAAFLLGGCAALGALGITVIRSLLGRPRRPEHR